MKTLLKAMLTALLSLVLSGPGASAEERPAFTQAELDQMLAPIALYPDPLLSQILMASTYPVEVVQAARWSRANPYLQGEDAVRAVEPMDWDPSVKSLVAFPQILDRMNDQIDWTERLGDAFVAQELQVMDTIQDLRLRADAAGNLRPAPEMRIVREGGYILIEPASVHLLHVPYYDPVVVYGPWRWRAHRPVRWAPWPGYYGRTTYPLVFLWGSGTVIRTEFLFGSFNWRHRYVVVVHPKPANVIVHRHVGVIHSAPAPHSKPVRWKHDLHRGKGVSHPSRERRDSTPTHRVKSDRVLHLDGFGHVLNPPHKTPKGPSLRTKAQPMQPARTGQDLKVKQTDQTSRSTMRSASVHRNAERPPATVRIGVSASQALASRGSNPRAPEHNSANARMKESVSAANPTGGLTTSRSHETSSLGQFGTHPSVNASSSRPALRSSVPMISRPASVGLR
jgi:hypothetical protein